MIRLLVVIEDGAAGTPALVTSRRGRAWDGYLNDINGFHVKKEDVFRALESARGGTVSEGNVGGGTGMVCYGFKGGDGTASRVMSTEAGGYTVSVMVQLKRLARRATTGLARTVSSSGNSSGDIFVAFSTANHDAAKEPGPNQVLTVSNERMSPLFQATVEATEEAIVNAMVSTQTMTGIEGHMVDALPHDKLAELMKRAPGLSVVQQ